MSRAGDLLSPQPRAAAMELLRLAGPLIAVSASRMLMGFIDFVMVSRLGTDAQAAISPAALLVWGFLGIGMGAATSVQTFASQADGRGEPERGAAYTWQTLYLALGFAPVAVLAMVVIPPLYEWIGALARHTATVRALEVSYTRVAVWSLVPAVFACGLESFFNGIQRPRITLVAVLVSLVVNAAGNWLLIWGNLGFPRLGIAGAGLATVIGWWSRVLTLLVVFCSPGFDRRYGTRTAWAPSWRKSVDIFYVGGPTSVGWLLDIGAWIVFLNLIVPLFGTAALAATNIALQYTHLAFMPAIGLGLALCSQVGFAIGAGRLEEAVHRTRIALMLTMVYMGTIGLLLFLFRRPLLWIMNDDPAVLSLGVWIMCWVAIYQAFDAMSITFIFALRGAGDTRVPAVVNGLCCWGLFIGGGLVVARLLPSLGVHGPWLMAVAYLTVLGPLLYWRYRSGAWRRMRVFSETRAMGIPATEAALPTGLTSQS